MILSCQEVSESTESYFINCNFSNSNTSIIVSIFCLDQLGCCQEQRVILYSNSKWIIYGFHHSARVNAENQLFSRQTMWEGYWLCSHMLFLFSWCLGSSCTCGLCNVGRPHPRCGLPRVSWSAELCSEPCILGPYCPGARHPATVLVRRADVKARPSSSCVRMHGASPWNSTLPCILSRWELTSSSD